jgi:two-component system heavy metal sensor histidine kinase CusS
MGEAEVALMHDMKPEEYRKVLESGIEEYARLSHLVNNLLFLAHAEDPSMAIERTIFDPVKEIRDIYTLYAPMAEEKEAVFTCGGSVLLNGDPSLFRRAVGNLLLNALYYSPQGVKVDVSVRETDDHYTEIDISDTGFGIDEEKLHHIFDRFYRGDNSQLSNTGGAGLGLSIVKAIVDLHGGSVSIKSKPDAGTTVTLRFPKQLPTGA